MKPSSATPSIFLPDNLSCGTRWQLLTASGRHCNLCISLSPDHRHGLGKCGVDPNAVVQLVLAQDCSQMEVWTGNAPPKATNPGGNRPLQGAGSNYMGERGIQTCIAEPEHQETREPQDHKTVASQRTSRPQQEKVQKHAQKIGPPLSPGMHGGFLKGRCPFPELASICVGISGYGF